MWCQKARTPMASVVAAVVLAAVGAIAQPQVGTAPRRERLELLRMWRLVEELGIDEQQAEKVFPVLRRHRVAHEALAARHRELLASLRQQLDSGAGDDVLLASIDQIQVSAKELREHEASLPGELAGSLSTAQQARLLLFDQSFRTDLRDIVRRMRFGGQEPPGDEMPPPFDARRWPQP